ncbi:MAG: 3-deoxy-manno-octulosonate cytidylyltransferase [Candidatus Aminicenantes bacterium]|nr:MAG: 3-deoxy-manno-octulosonate cytidylyltransferase [Candidatus Aminicenantes bacterium]
MNIAAIIPARYNSTRFKGKPLVMIKGMPMIQRVYWQVEKSGKFSPGHIMVATDDRRIESVVKSFGGNAVMTSPHHSSGSERLWEVLENRDFDAVINIQGDEPIVPVELISVLYDELHTGKYEVVTPAFYNISYEDFLSKDVVKVVVDRIFQALYFSRSPIPFVEKKDFRGFHQHIGMYGYLKEALRSFINLPRSSLEVLEKLEQLRFLENSIGIKVIISEYRSIGVDIPEDVAKVEEILEGFGTVA